MSNKFSLCHGADMIHMLWPRKESLRGLLLLACFGCFGCSDQPATYPPVLPSLDEKIGIRLAPNGIVRRSLGVFCPSEQRVIPIRLENNTGHPLQWASIRTSCECLNMLPPAGQLGVGGQLDGEIIIDLTHTPEFRGGLLLIAEAISADSGRPIFTLALQADVN